MSRFRRSRVVSRGSRRGHPLAPALVLLGLALAAGAAGAQEPSTAADANTRAPRFLLALASERSHPVPLDLARTPILLRRIAVDLDGVPLKQALAEVAARSGLPLVYGDGVLPVERRVHLRAEQITVVAALTDLLADAGVDVLFNPAGGATIVGRQAVGYGVLGGAVVGRVTDAKTGQGIVGATVVVERTSHHAASGNDGRYRIAEIPAGTYTVRARYIGYAPGSTSVTVNAEQDAAADFALEKSAQRLDEVVTTGTMVPTEIKALPTPISVVTGDEIEQKGYQRVDQIFRGDVPGAIAWDPGPVDYHTTVIVRGASTLFPNGSSGIKTLVDGVEVADQVYIADIDPNNIDRIEVTRGPQASTIYGAGSLTGVMQIFTKKGQFGLARPEVSGRASVGAIEGFGGQGAGLQTDNTVSLLGGGEKASYSLGAAYSHVGDWVASYGSRTWGAWTGGRTNQGPFTISGSARYSDKTLDSPWDLRLQSFTAFSRPPYETERVRQQTYGVTASVQAARSWRHTLTLGYDQTYYSLDQTQPRFTTPADSFLSSADIHEGKASLLYHTDVSFRLAAGVAGTITTGLNYDSYSYVLSTTSGASSTRGLLDGSSSVIRTPWTNTGYFGQMQLALAERLFLTGGLRAERNPNFGPNFGTAWSPRVGAAYALMLGPASAKLRASYGESIRAPDPSQREPRDFLPYFRYLANPDLGPERQRGWDSGVELYFGHRVSLGVTHYNQRAIGLIQEAVLPTPPGGVLTYQFQNVGTIENEGWEFEGRLQMGPAQVAGTYSIANSNIRELSADYPSGDYQVGDPILGVPHTSAGVTVTYSPIASTTLSASMMHIGQRIESDFLGLYGYFSGAQAYRGSQRAYWMQYPAVTKFGVAVRQRLTPGLEAFARVENVGNTLRFERNNLDLPRPRSAIVGATFRY